MNHGSTLFAARERRQRMNMLQSIFADGGDPRIFGHIRRGPHRR